MCVYSDSGFGSGSVSDEFREKKSILINRPFVVKKLFSP